MPPGSRAGSADLRGNFAHARAYYRAAVEALATTGNERAAAAASRTVTAAIAATTTGDGDGGELPMTRAVRSWATMESYLRSVYPGHLGTLDFDSSAAYCLNLHAQLEATCF